MSKYNLFLILIIMQADVNRVSWQIDKYWFASYGVYFD